MSEKNLIDVKNNVDSAETALTDKKYWGQRPLSQSLKPDSGLEPYLGSLLPTQDDWTVLEIGAVPGNVLLWFAKRFHYKPVGLDFLDNVFWVQQQFAMYGIQGRFIQADFLSWDSMEQFDVVYSGGFIEHFLNYQEIVERHWDLTRPGGYLVITVPLLSPAQMLIRRIVWNQEQLTKILESHNLQAMNLENLGELVANFSKAKILFLGPIHGLTCWIHPNGPGVKKGVGPLFFCLKVIQKIFQRLKWSSLWFSPMILLVAQKDK